MQNLKITLVQIDQIWENKEANFKQYEEQLLNVETDLIVLPEMFQTGFTMNVLEMGEKWNDSNSVRWLQKMAKEKETAIYTSLIIKDELNYFNRGVFVFPNGQIEYYDKRKSFGLAGEDKVFTAGKKEQLIEFKGWKIQLQICFDLRFPEISRNYIEKNNQPSFDLLLYVANWPEKRIIHWDTLLKARAIENQCFVVGVNRIGTDNNKQIYNGHSKIISPQGDEHEFNNELKLTKTILIESESLLNTRKKLPFLCKRYL